MTLAQIQEACEWMDRAARDLRVDIPEPDDTILKLTFLSGKADGFEEAARFLRALALKADVGISECSKCHFGADGCHVGPCLSTDRNCDGRMEHHD